MKSLVIVAVLAVFLATPASAAGPRDWLEDEIGDVVNNTSTLITRTEGLKERTINIKEQVDRIIGLVDDGLGDLTGEMREMFRNGIAELRAVIDEEREGLGPFLGSAGDGGPGTPCAVFRGQLTSLVLSVEGLTNELLDSRLLPDFHVSFRPFVAVLERAPGASLYPLYRAMSVETNFLERGAALLETARARLALARACLGLGADASEDLDECAQLGCDPAECLQTAKDLRSVSTLMTVVGRILVAWGETKFNGEFQVHGYVGGSIYNNRKKKLGNMFVGAADALGGMATSLETKVRYCILRRDQLAILANQQRIMEKLGICRDQRKPDPCGDDAKCPPDDGPGCDRDRSPKCDPPANKPPSDDCKGTGAGHPKGKGGWKK